MTATSTDIAKNFSDYLAKVMQGETVEVTYHGKRAAIFRPAPGKMSGREYAAIFSKHQADPKTAKELKRVLHDYDANERSVFDRHLRVR